MERPDRDDGLLHAAAAGDSPVTFAEEGVGVPSDDSGLSDDAGSAMITAAGGGPDPGDLIELVSNPWASSR